jgi:hypothetical protein
MSVQNILNGIISGYDVATGDLGKHRPMAGLILAHLRFEVVENNPLLPERFVVDLFLGPLMQHGADGWRPVVSRGLSVEDAVHVAILLPLCREAP